MRGADYAVVSVPVPRVDLGGLTRAEREVLTLLLAYADAVEVARRRGRSVRTVRHQIEAIYRKLDVRSRAELAIRCGVER